MQTVVTDNIPFDGPSPDVHDSTRTTRQGPPKLAFADGGPLVIPADAPRTMAEALIRSARLPQTKGIITIRTDGTHQHLSYASLLRLAQSVCAGLKSQAAVPTRPTSNAGSEGHSREVVRGTPVILQVPDLMDHWIAFWGCVLAGFSPVTVAVAPSYAERNGVVNKLLNTWTLLGHPPILTNRALLPSVSGLSAVCGMEPFSVAIEDLKSFSPCDDLVLGNPDDSVFLQLTSGSTGIPKCIQETNRGVISHIHSSQQFNGYTSDDVSLNWLPVDHVVPTLTCHLRDVYLGCQQIHVDTGLVLAEPLKWLDLIEKHRVTLTWSPNFGFKLVSDRLARSAGKHWELSTVRFFMNAGEQVTVPVLESFLKAVAPFGVRTEAMQPAFGMAEACTCMTYQNQFNFESGVHRVRKSSLGGKLRLADPSEPEAICFVDLGPPTPGVQIRITNDRNLLVPEGVIGRFQIKGPVITPGYLNNPEANEEAFVGDGWFNSGDRGFILDGRLTLTGREKEMIIIRGANFYCYEIEDVVNQTPGVTPTFAAACGVLDQQSGTESLVIFFVPAESIGLDSDAIVRNIKMRIAASLGVQPRFVIPLQASEFPKTTSGKIQRTQLKRRFEAGEFTLDQESSALNNAETALTAREKELAELWREVLGAAPASDTAFFEIGDSLRATQLIARVRDRYEVQLPFRALFEEASTLGSMAQFIERASAEIQIGADSIDAAWLQPAPRTAALPASFSQQRIWLTDQRNPGSSVYNVALGVWLHGSLNRQALEQSINRIVNRHEIWRTTYAIDDGGVVQQIDPVMRLELAVERVPDSGHLDRRVHARELARANASVPFDLSAGPVIRAKLFELTSDEHLLCITAHQIAVDEWSWNVFLAELAENYEVACTGRRFATPPPPIQYADFAAWQRRQIGTERLNRQTEYWQTRLADAPSPSLELPGARFVNGRRTHFGDIESLKVPTALFQRLKEFGRQNGATPFMVSLAAFNGLLHWLTHREDITVGSSAGGRAHLQTERLIGFFVNTVVLRNDLSGDPTFPELLRRVRNTVIEAHSNQEAPFDKVVELLRPPRRNGEHPFFNVWFQLNEPLRTGTAAGVTFAPERLRLPVAQFDLTLFACDTRNGLECDLEYSTELFDRAAAVDLLRRWVALMEQISASPDSKLSTILQGATRRSA